MDKKLFAEQMGKLGIVFDREITGPLAELYFDDLKQLTNAQMVQAVTKWRHEGEWFPRPSQLLDMIVTSTQASGEAWQHVLKELRDSANAKLSPAELQAVNEIGGIESLSRMDFGQLEFKGKEFRAAYNPDRLEEVKERISLDPEMKAYSKLVDTKRIGR